MRERISDVEFAAYFVAIQAGGVERILRRHYPMPNGLCAGCLATPTKDPCQAARIAELAKQHAEYRIQTTHPTHRATGLPERLSEGAPQECKWRR